MTEPYDFAAQCKRLADEAIPRIAEVQRRLAEDNKAIVRSSGRLFTDEDPKRGSESPLGGKVW